MSFNHIVSDDISVPAQIPAVLCLYCFPSLNSFRKDAGVNTALLNSCAQLVSCKCPSMMVTFVIVFTRISREGASQIYIYTMVKSLITESLNGSSTSDVCQLMPVL